MSEITIKMVAASALLLGLVACSSTPQALEQSQTAARAEKAYSENYQEIYRRLVTTAKRCLETTGPYTSFELDSELYSELGYGEATYSLQDLGARNYYWKAKISKTDAGTTVTVVAGNTLAKNAFVAKVIEWADGKEGC